MRPNKRRGMARPEPVRAEGALQDAPSCIAARLSRPQEPDELDVVAEICCPAIEGLPQPLIGRVLQVGKHFDHGRDAKRAGVSIIARPRRDEARQ